MNIIFEGVNGAGKSTIIKELVKIMEKNNMDVKYVDDLDISTPTFPALAEMFKNSPFLEMKKEFNTSLVESLILAADYHYLKDMLKDLTGYKIYDRDFFTTLVYQSYFLEKYYNDLELVKLFKNILLYDPKKIDLIIYVDISFEESLKRTERRDNRTFTDEEKDILKYFISKLKEEVKNYSVEKNVPLLIINGQDNTVENAELVYNKIREVG